MQGGAEEVREVAGAPARATGPLVACPRRELVSSRQLLSPMGLRRVGADPFPRGSGWKTESWGAAVGVCYCPLLSPDPRTFLLLRILLAHFAEEHPGLVSFRDRPGSGWLVEMPV